MARKLNKQELQELRRKAMEELKLLIFGRTFKEEYIGLCYQRYYVTRWLNKIVIMPRVAEC